jgi:uncharacterized protein YndB with AHSA1/START domain
MNPNNFVLKLERELPVTPEVVFNAFTDPQALRAWWGPPGTTTVKADVDLRVGGRYRWIMRSDDSGETYVLTGKYLEVSRPHRLRMTWAWEQEPQLGEMQVTLELEPTAAGTRLLLTHELLPSAKARDSHERGWWGSLERLQHWLGTA